MTIENLTDIFKPLKLFGLVGAGLIVGSALLKGVDEEEIIRKAKLKECFADVSFDFISFKEGYARLDEYQNVEITTVSTKEGEENFWYLLEWNQIAREEPRNKPHKSGSLNLNDSPYKQVVFSGDGHSLPSTVYRQIEPSEEQVSNLAGFRSCVGLESVSLELEGSPQNKAYSFEI